MKIIKNLYWLLLIVVAFISSCKKEVYTLEALPDKSQVKFEAIQDKSIDAGGNTVILVNNTPGAVAIWDYSTGKSNRDRDTVRYAFKGDYVIRFSAMTAGGVVKADSVIVKVTQDNFDYVSDPLWIYLTGGPGNEKTWYLDYGKHGMFDGPLSFYEPQTTWTEIQAKTAKLGWAPAWKDNQWIISGADSLSTMTFSLKGGPFFKNHKVTEGKDESGTFSFNAAAKTIGTSGGTILRSASFISNASNWNNNLVVLSLTEDQLQIGVRRTNSEGDYLYVWNFISKEYKNSYVPKVVAKPVDAGFNPKFAAGELLNFLTDGVSRTWKMDADGNPVDWLAAGKGWTTGFASTAGWGWDPASWSTALNNSYIKFEKSGLKYTRFQGGVKTTGTFTVDESQNEVNLVGNTLLQNTSSWMNSTQTKLKVVKAFPKDISKGIWFGVSFDTSKNEWFAFHYVLF